MSSENVVEEIKLHQETISSDNNSPLHKIREKELEISGRMLAAKREADETLSAARKKAAEIVAAAETEGGSGARGDAESTLARARAEADALVAAANAEADAIRERVATHQAEAVNIVTEAVMTV